MEIIDKLLEINTKLEVKHHTTNELASVIETYSTKQYGPVQKNPDCIQYRYIQYISNYSNTPVWLKKLFEKAAKECGCDYQTSFSDGKYSFSFDRAKFKGHKNGKIFMNELVILGYDLKQK